MGLELSTKTIFGIVVGIIILLVLLKFTSPLLAFILPGNKLDKDTQENFERLVDVIKDFEDESSLVYYIANGKSLISFNKAGEQEIQKPNNIKCSDKSCLCICEGIKKDSCSEPFLCESFENIEKIKDSYGEQITIKGSKTINLHFKLVDKILLIQEKEFESGASGEF